VPVTDTELIARSRWTGNEGRVYHNSDLGIEERLKRHGRGAIDMPGSFVAGEGVDIVFRFEIGETELARGARLRVAWRWPFDWADLQQSDPSRPNFLDTRSPADVEVSTLYERRGDLNPWHHDILITVDDGRLEKGDILEVRCRSWEGPTFATDDGYFLMLLNPEGDDAWIRLVDPPRFRIEPGEPSQIIAIAPSGGYVGEEAVVRVRAIDSWANATPIDRPSIQGFGVAAGEPQLNSRFPVWEVPILWGKEGVHRIDVSADGFSCLSNPVQVTADKDLSRLHWGDLHAGQSEIGCGAGTLDHHFAYARDVAGLEFASQQANDHYVTRAIWEHVREVTRHHNDEGHFLAYLGCEWSPYTPDGGDRNVIYMDDEPRMRRSDRFFQEREPDPEPDLPRAPEFLDAFRSQDVILNLHVGGRPTNLDWHCPEIEPLFEIHSTHATSEWFLQDAIERGYLIGVTAGTDGVMGRPGACGPGRRVTRNVANGLTAVRARELTQQSVAEAFRNRSCYGTTGARILLDVCIDGQPMGSIVDGKGSVSIQVVCEGSAGVERIDLFRDSELFESRQLAHFDEDRYRILWGGTAKRGTAGDQRQIWDGEIKALGGIFNDVDPVGFQCPLDALSIKGDQVSWTSATAGNDMGFVFECDADTVEFRTQLIAGSVRLQDLGTTARTFDAGGLDRRLEITRAPSESTSPSARETFIDTSPLAGRHAYWIRVIQTDRHRAWSSPIYVERSEADTD